MRSNPQGTGAACLFRLPGGRPADAGQVRVPQFAPLFPALDLPQASSLVQVFHHSRPARAQRGGQSSRQFRGPRADFFEATATNHLGAGKVRQVSADSPGLRILWWRPAFAIIPPSANFPPPPYTD